MGYCVEISSIVTLTFCTQSIDTLKTQAFPVNGKSVVIGNGFIFRAAPVFLSIVPVLVAARANTSLRLAERAAEFLPDTIIVGSFAILAHGKACRADRIAGRKRFQNLRITRIERDKCLAS